MAAVVKASEPAADLVLTCYSSMPFTAFKVTTIAFAAVTAGRSTITDIAFMDYLLAIGTVADSIAVIIDTFTA